MIETQSAKVYFAKTAGRRFFTKDAAIRRETMAIILKKYPTVLMEPDTGFYFDCREMDGFETIYRRLKRLVASSI